MKYKVINNGKEHFVDTLIEANSLINSLLAEDGYIENPQVFTRPMYLVVEINTLEPECRYSINKIIHAFNNLEDAIRFNNILTKLNYYVINSDEIVDLQLDIYDSDVVFMNYETSTLEDLDKNKRYIKFWY